MIGDEQMDKKIYELLNDAEVGIHEEDKEQFTQLDQRRMKMNIKKHLKKQNGYKKGLLVASALVISIGTISYTPVLANVAVAIESIASYMGREKELELENYRTVVGKGVTKNGVTLTLNEVILNNDELIVSTTARADEQLGERGIRYSSKVYINNKLVSEGSSGGSWSVDEYTEQSIETSLISEEELSGDLKVKVVFDGMRVNNNRKLGKWVFEFQTTGDQLRADTQRVAIDYNFELEDGTKVKLESIENNELGPKIYFSTENNGMLGYDLLLKGKDNLGNEIEFYMSHYRRNKGGVFKLSFINDEIIRTLSKEVKSLTLTPYAVAFPEESGKLSNDFKAVGEAFTINLE